VAQSGIPQACGQFPVVAVGRLAIEQQAEAFLEAERGSLVGRHDLVEGLCHAEESQLVQAIEGGMGKH
jgi:hypothetical protein